MTEELPRWVDGKQFVEWLGKVRPNFRASLTTSDKRNLCRMTEENGVASVRKADRLCVTLDLHLSEIPDEIWLHTPPGRVWRHSPDTKAAALEMVEAGAKVREVSDKFAVNEATLRSWVRKARS